MSTRPATSSAAKSAPDASRRAAARRRAQQRRRPRVSRLLAWLLAAWLGHAGLALAQVAPGALPSGGQVMVGSGQLQLSPGLLVIQQNSNRLGLDWQSFNIGSGATVEFRQPGAGSVALNRVVGNSGSEIYGRLLANGQVFLTNPNGVLFAPGSKVDVGGLVASTLDLSQQDFADGRYVFNASGAQGRVVNQGSLNASAGGYLALFGQSVDNQGDMAVQAGSVVLASGRAATVSISGSGLISAVVTPGTVQGSVDNGGRIAADGGMVTLSAKSAQDIAASLVNNSGIVRANTLVEKAGEIWITGDHVQHSGQLSAAAPEGGNAGRVMVLADMTRGTVRLDGTLDASAAGGGQGGFIETSAAHVKVDEGTRVTTAAHGARTGTWLIDPNDYTVAASGGNITGATLSANLASSNVQISTLTQGTVGNGDIFVNDVVSWGANKLTLTAERNIAINSALTGTGTSSLALEYGQAAVAAGNTATYSVNAPVALPAGSSFSTKLGSNGTTNTFTVVVDAAGLQGIDSLSRTGNFALGAAIDLSSIGNFNPIGNETTATINASNSFGGRLDGLGHTVSGLTTSGHAAAGLFATTTTGADIRNLTLSGGAVTGTGNAGALAGLTSATTVVQVRSTTPVSSSSTTLAVGGLIGSATTGSIANSSVGSPGAPVAISGGSFTGGLVGNATTPIINSSAAATLTGTATAMGGLVGNTTAAISGSSATGTAQTSGNADLGGLIGRTTAAVSSSTASVAVTATNANSHVGGLIGESTGAISGSSASGAVSGGAQVGGLVGSYASSSSISTSSASGNVSSTVASADVGGLVGNASGAGSVTGSSASGNVSAAANADSVGGLAGEFSMAGGIVNSSAGAAAAGPTAASTVTGGNYTGGVVGWYSSATNLVNDASNTIAFRGATVTGTTWVGGLVGYVNTTAALTMSGPGAGTPLATNVVATGSGGAAGVLAGRSNGAVSGFSASGTVTAAGNAGGLVGNANGAGGFSNVAATGAVTSTGTGGAVGGLVGSYTNSGTLSGTVGVVTASGPVQGGSGSGAVTGGLVGSFNSAGSIVDASTAMTSTVAGGGNTGGLVGEALGSGSAAITGSTARGAVTGAATDTGYVGGLVGSFSMAGGWSNVTAQGEVSGGSRTGGLAGNYASAAAITGGTFSGSTVTGGSYVGGLVGYLGSTAAITGPSAVAPLTVAATVSGRGHAGGLVGYTAGNVTNARATGSVSSTGTGTFYVGGLIGQADGTGGVTDVSATGTVTSASTSGSVGGLIGYANFGGVVRGTATNTTVSGGLYTGGLVGYFDPGAASIQNSTASANVNGFGDVGGLVGFATGTGGMAGSAATGTVASSATSNYSVGGIAGYFALSGGISTTTTSGNVSGGAYTGGAIGYYNTTTALTGLTTPSTVTTVTGSTWVGGVVGYVNQAAALSGLSSSATVTATGSGSGAAGGVAGRSNGSVSASSASGNVSGQYAVGGLIGVAEGTGTLTDSSATGNVTGSLGQAWIGGLVGRYALSGSISGTISATGVVSGGSSAGGVVGYYNSAAPVAGLTRGAFNVTGQDWVGGLIGYSEASSITGSSSAAAVTATGPSYAAGGLVGRTGGAITGSSATGSVTAAGEAGGLVGRAEGTANFTDVTASGAVQGSTNVGGLVGAYNSNALILRGTASGAVTTARTGGGLVGYHDGGPVTDSNATGAVNGLSESTLYLGGLIGQYGGTCYYCQLNNAFVISNSHATGAVRADASYGFLGGLVGLVFSGIINNSSASGKVTTVDSVSSNSSEYTGGLVGFFGYYNQDGTISGSNASGAVSGGYYSGGLVGYYNGGAISNSSASGAVTDGVEAGGLIGYGQLYGTMSNVSATGNVTGSANSGGDIGGLVGQLAMYTNSGQSVGGGINNGSASGNVSSSSTGGSVGGLIGYLTASSSGVGPVNDSRASGSVTGGSSTGGLIGYFYNYYGYSALLNSSATGQVIGGTAAGGLVGEYYRNLTTGRADDITNSFATGRVGGSTYMGGLVGQFQGRYGIVGSYASGDVVARDISGSKYMGGLAGYYYANHTSSSVVSAVNASYATGRVSLGAAPVITSGTNVYAGGLVGYLGGNLVANAVVDAYATGGVTLASTLGRLNAGGLVGYAESGQGVLRGYATGVVSATGGSTRASGGLLAARGSTASVVTDSYWDSTSTGQATSLGGGTARSTAEMHQAATYGTWNLATTGTGGTTWRIYDGHTAPLLSRFLTPRTVTLADATKIYDGTLSFGNATVTASNGAIDYPERIFTSISAADVGSYAVDAAGVYSVQNGYDLTVTGSAQLTVTQRPITLAGVVADRAYDGTRTATLLGTAQPAGVVAGETLTVNTNGATAVFDTKNVGQNKGVTITGLSLADGATGKAANYSLVSATATTASITPAALNAGGFTATNRAYDGSTSVAVSAAGGTVSGVFGSDDVTVSVAGVTGGTIADKNVGTAKPVTVLGATLTGTDAGNYVIGGIGSVTVDITPRSLAVNGLLGSNRIYDQGVNVSVSTSTGVLSGTVAGDLVQLRGNTVTGTMADRHAGTGKTVAVAGNQLQLRGTDAANYTVANATATVDISRAPIYVYADYYGTSNDKVYDGTDTAGVTPYGYSPYSGGYLLPGTTTLGIDNLTLTTDTPRYSSKDVAYSGGNVTSKTITVANAVLGGSNAGNYVLDNTSNTTSGRITPKPLSVTGVSAVDRVYDGSTAVQVSVSGASVDVGAVISGDNVTVTLPGTGTVAGTMATKNAGTAKPVTVPGFVLSGTDAGNYTLSGSAGVTVNIAKKDLTAAYTGIDKVYDGNANAAVIVSSTDIIGTDDVSFYTDVGYCGSGCGFSYFATPGSTPTSFTTSKDAGSDKLVVIRYYYGDGLYGNDAANYNFLNPTGTTTASITPKGITPVFTGVNKVYDGSTAATVNVNTGASGIVSGDAVSLSRTAAFDTKDAGTGKTVSITGIAFTGAAASNYTVASTTATTTANITPKALAVAGVTATNRAYDGTTSVALSVGTLGATGLVDNDVVTVNTPAGGIGTGSIASKAVGTGKPVTVAGLTLSGADAGNYSIDGSQGVTVDITRRALTVGYTGQTREYNGGVSAGVTPGSADIINGDTLSFTQNAIFTGLDAKNVGTGKPISVTSIVVGGADAANYSLQNTTATTTGGITPKGITVGYAANGVPRYYNGLADVGASANVVGSSAGLVAGDVVGFTQTATFTGDGAAGLNKPVSVGSIALTGSAAANYSLLNTTASTSVTILPKLLGITGVTAADRAYDGTTSVQLSTAGATVLPSGVLAGDDVSVVLPGGGITTGTLPTKDAGSNRPVSITGLSLSGSSSANYSVGATGLTVTITPRSLTALYAATDRVYDGGTTVGVTAGSVDILTVDLGALGIAANGQLADGKNVGTAKPVTISGGFLTGAERNNYTLLNPTGTATVDITPKSLTPAYTGGTRVYDGGVGAPVTAGDAGVVAGDAVIFSQTAVFTGSGAKNVGSGKAVAVSAIALGGADAANYQLAATTAATTAAITPKPISIDGLTGAQAIDRVYDGTRTVGVNVTTSGTLSPSSADIVAGDQVTIELPAGGITTGTVATKTVGSNKAVVIEGLGLSGADAANYRVQATSGVTVDITPRALTSVYAGISKVYDGSTAATAGGSSADILAGDSVSISASGVFTGSGARNVGTNKAIDVFDGRLGGADAVNYALTNPTGTATATITPRVLTPSYGAVTKVYDGLLTAPVVSTTSGLISGDAVALQQTAVFTTGKDVGSDKPVQVSAIGLTGSDAGNYALAATSAATTGSITPRPLRIDGLTGVDAVDRVYNGSSTVDVVVTSTGPVAPNPADLVAGDVVTVTAPSTGLTTGTMADKNAGLAKPVAVSGLSLGGADAGNYSVAATSGVTVDITPRPLTASYSAGTRVYDGTAAASITGTSADQVAGDVLGITGSGVFTGAGARNVGNDKAVSVLAASLQGSDAANYALQNPTGTATGSITPKAVSVGYQGGTRVYDGSVVAPVSGTASGFIAGDAVALTETAVFTGAGAKNVGTGKAVDITGIGLTGIDAPNYALTGATTLTTTASVTPRPLRIDGFTGVVATDRVYDGTTLVALTVQSTGTVAPNAADLITGDDVGVTLPGGGSSTGTVSNKNAGTGKPVTVSGLSLTGADAGNYSVAAATGVTVNITPRALSASYAGVSRIYDGSTAASIIGASGDIITGDALSITGSGLFTGAGAKNVGTGKAISVTAAALGGADAGNYTLTNPTGSAVGDITPRLVTPVYTGGSRVYDRGVSAPVSAALDSLVVGDDVAFVQTAVFTGAGARNVGVDKAVEVSGIGLQGADAANYALTGTTVLTTATITPRPLNIGGLSGLQAVDRVYDGTRDVQVTGSAVIGTATGDVVTGDDVTINLPSGSISAGTMVDKSAGAGKAVAVSGLSLSGADAPNYQITGVAGLTVNIAPRPVLLLGVSAVNRVYDGSTVVAINSAGGSLSGVLAGDDLQLRASGVTGSMADKHAGTGKAVSVTGLSLSGADIANYAVDNGGGLRVDITPRTLVATASAADKFYDGSNVAAVTLADDRIAGDALSLTSSGATFSGKDAGPAQTVSVGGLALTGADAGDYVLLSGSLVTTASINRAPLTVGANSLSKVYGESVNLTGAEFTTLGLVAGESLGLVTLASDGTASAAPVTGSPYAITVSDARGGSFNPANYALTYTSGVLTVTPRPLTIAANSVVRTADEPNPASFGFSTSVGGLTGGDSITSVVLNAPTGSATAAGGSIFELVPSGAVFGAGQASNYALSYDSGLLVVLPRPPRVDDVDPNAGNTGQQGFAVQVDQAELERALDALQRSAGVVAQDGVDTSPGLPPALRNVEATAAEITVALAGDSRQVTLPALLRLPLISFDPKLRRLIFGGPATGSTPPSSTAP